MKFKLTDKFFNAIPKNLEENIAFRKTLHSWLEKDKSAQNDFITLCLLDPKIPFNAAFWTFNPRKPVGYRHHPFILRPQQEKVVDAIHLAVEPPSHNLGINKSRDEGCTEIVCKYAALRMFVPDDYIVVGSRNKVLVDERGDKTTLMAKIDYALDTMPLWMQQWIDYPKGIDRKEMQLWVKKTDAAVRGETTNENFSAGRRSTFMFFDEFGRVESRIARSIEGSIHDVTDCIIYGSTHWYGETHPFNQVLKKKTTTVVSLPWWENPEKNAGLYTSPDYDEIEIIDVDYYKKNYPNISKLHSTEPFRIRDLEIELMSQGYGGEVPNFVGDKCETIPGDLRSPWHDHQEEDRKGDKRDFMSNVWMSPIAAQDSFFDGIVLERVKGKFVHEPRYKGDITFEYDDDGRVSSYRFIQDTPRTKLLWYSDLEGLRPNQEHNYVIGCDLSYGSGASNSVAAIYDVNSQELVGLWVCPNTRPDPFVDTIVALARWCGGQACEALVIYESNGPGVNAFKRLRFNGHRRIYTQRTEEAKKAKKKNSYGWASNPNKKEAMLGELGSAMSESLKSRTSAKSCIIHDEETIHEMQQYVFLETGGVGISEEQDLSSGARSRHGDRVIAVGLAVLGSKYQQPASYETVQDIPHGTFAYLLEQEKNRIKKIQRETRRY